tara:strand:- start:283 stop:561 length:279 start_codon:yes stop_codon:yes gene_type:complete
MIISFLKNSSYRAVVTVSTLGGFTFGTCNGISQIKNNTNINNQHLKKEIRNNILILTKNIGSYTLVGFVGGSLFPITVPLSMYLLSDLNNNI